MEKDPKGDFVLDSGIFYYVDESIDAFNDRYRVKDLFNTLAIHSYRLAGAMIEESKNYNN